MAKREARFLTGLFVIVGLLTGAAAVVWVGASKYFEQGTQYVTYFDESVQGLQVDSEVKYRGVGVGNVKSIKVASDQKLVEVVIKISLEGDVEHTMVTQLRAAGITGIVFVELDQRLPDEQVLIPPQEMGNGRTIIPSRPSQTKQMLSGIDKLLERFTQVDLKGISDQVKATSRAVETFFAGPAMKRIVANLDSTALSLAGSMKRIDALLAAGDLQGVVDDTRQGLREARRGIAETRELVATLKQAIVNLKTAELSDKAAALTDRAAALTGSAGRLVDGIDRRTRKMATDVESTTEEIRQAVDQLRALLERLRQNPSDLIFSKPVGDNGETEER
ncbi:MAG: MlaD family protein [Syntrophales bacterium]